MQLLKARAALAVIIALISITQIFGVNNASNIFLKSDTIVDVEEKIESLINTSKKLEDISLSLSLDAIDQAHKLSVKNGKNELIALSNHQIGVVQTKIDSTDKALTSLKRSLQYYEKFGEKIKIASILVDIGYAYFKNNQFKKSLIYFNSALSEYYEISDSLGIVNCYSFIGQSNNALGNDDIAIVFFKDAINISLNNNYNYYIALNYLKLSEVQLELGLTDDILSQINLAIEFANILNDNNLVANAHLFLNQYYLSIGNKTEALNQLNKYISISDSINNVNNVKLEEFLIKLSNIIDEPKKKYTTEYIFGGIIIALVIVILFTLYKIKYNNAYYSNYHKKSKAELIAFDATTSNYEEKIKQKTENRVIEIKEEINRNNNDEIALSESIKKLDQINYLKDIFLSKISHEIRTPLSGILGFSSLLETELALLEDKSLFEFANSISQSGSSLVSLLNNILDISRLDSNNITLDISKRKTNELIQGIVDTYEKEASLKGIKLIFPANEIPDINTDSQVFSKTLSLILDNSVKFTEKGFIKISHKYDEKTNMITILIKDTGIGIDKVYIDKVFEPFRQESLGYSTLYQGAGLGLPLAKKMSEKLGGSIDIQSEKGDGTTIILSFPAYIIKKEVKEISVSTNLPKKSQKETLPWESLSVLVVEDNSMNQILYKKMLKKARILEIAKNGKVALNIIEKQIEKNNFQIVLMDINLPAPWDGISLMKEIRNRWPAYQNIPFIAQTAYAMSGSKEVMMEEGFDDYITKPIIKSTLIKSFNSVIYI